MNMLEPALKWHDAGCSVIPILQDGSKKPLLVWKPYQSQAAVRADVAGWFKGSSWGIGIVCGAVSGNLEMLELEGRATSGDDFEKIYRECDSRHIAWLLDLLLHDGYAEWTPSGGLHMLYRIPDHEVPGNTKVARRPATEAELLENPDDRWKVLSETRGEGGYVIVAPSGGTVHPSGDSWSTVAGQIGVIPTVAWEDRCKLHEAITAALDEMPAPVLPPARTIPIPARAGILRPGDDFNLRAEWKTILEPHGWRVTEYRGNETFWMRPGKKFDGRGSHSATTGFKGAGNEDRLYVFSTSTEFDTETPYSKFAAFTLLECNGDFTAATKELARRGYGTSSARTVGSVPVVYRTETFDVPTGMVPVQEPSQEMVVPQQPMIKLRDGLPAVPVEQLQDQPWNDRGAMELYAEVFKDQFRHVSAEKSWRRWNGTRWDVEKRQMHRRAMQELSRAISVHASNLDAEGHPRADVYSKFAAKMSSVTKMAAIVNAVEGHPNIAATPEDFDQHQHLITTNNGILDLHSGQLGPHDPSLMLTKKIDAAFKPEAGSGRWGKFMEQVLPDPEVRSYLQRAFGYALTGEADKRAIFMLHGDSGSGKSQVLEGVQKVLGDFAKVIPGTTFQPSNTSGLSDALHRLRGARMVIQSELNENAILNEGLIKAATGGDTLSTRALYENYIDWRPEFVIFLATNFLPRVSTTDNALWRRVKPIKFEQKFIDDDGNPLDPSCAGIGVRIAQEEPEGVLNWLLEGLAAYRRDGLTPPDRVREWTQSYRDDVDTVRQFLTEGADEGRIKIEEGLETPFRELYRAYVAGCQDNQGRPVSSRKFNQSMESAGYVRVKKERGVVWKGIGLLGFIVESQKPVLSAGYWQRK